MNHNKYRKQGFTIIELIVVITILTILGTIGFVTMTGYFAGARDSTRVTDMNNIYERLRLSFGSNGSLPLPDNFATTTSSGEIVTYQGYAGKVVLGGLKFEKGGRDPQDDTYYTYTINKKKSQAQLMGYFEEYDTTKLSSLPSPIEQTYAAALTDYSDRKIGILGKMLGTLVASGTLVPLQQTSTGTLDISVSTGYTAYFSNTVVSTGSLSIAFQNNSIVYTSIAPENGACGTSNGILTTTTPTSNLCSTGTATTATGTGPWTWNCTGGGTGSTASCSALSYASVFATGSIYTTGWASNTCNPASITVVDVPTGTGTMPSSLLANTVYKLNSGDYFATGTINLANCSAIIGVGTGSTRLRYSTTATGNLISSVGARTNVIVSGLSLAPTGASPLKSGIELASNSSTYSQLSISGAGVTWGAGLRLTGGSTNLISKTSIFNSVGNGISIINSDNGSITDSAIDGALGTGVEMGGNSGTLTNVVSKNANYNIGVGNNSVLANVSTYGGNWGISVNYKSNVTITNATVVNPTFNGFDLYGTGIVVNNCIAVNGGQTGMASYGVGRTNVNNCIVMNSGQRGIISEGTAFSNMVAENNDNFGWWNNGGKRNVLSNSISCANAQYGYTTNGTGDILSDFTSCGNGFWGLSSSSGSYYGSLKVFSNNSSNTASSFQSGSAAAFTFFSTGAYSSAGTFDASWVVQPSNVTGWNALAIGRQTGLTWPQNPTFTYGSNVPNQKRPIRYNTTTGVLEEWGVDGVDYDSTKKIGQW